MAGEKRFAVLSVLRADGSSQKTEVPFPNSGGQPSKQLEAGLARLI